MTQPHNSAAWAVQLLIRYSGWYIAGIVLVTGLLILPMLLMAPEEQASQDPGGPVFELQERVGREFPARIHGAGFIVEDRQGDILRQRPLWELYQNQQLLRKSDLGGYLYNGYDPEAERQTLGLFTIADAVSLLLALDPEGASSLETATDLEVKLAVHRLLSGPRGARLRDSLSRDAESETRPLDGDEGKTFQYWRASALFFFVASDNALLGGGPPVLSLSNDQVTLDKERFNRRVQAALRGEQNNYRLWGLAIDVNLESREQGRTVMPYIGATVVLVLLVVGVALRSWSSAVFAAVGLLMVLVWLKGGSNLVGLNSSLTLDLIVPIAMISLGVDFFIHAAAPYREERRRGHPPSLSLGAGLAGVLGALTLAMLSDGIAFLANVASGIETIIGFAVAAGIATVASYLVMGLFLPLLRMRLDGNHYFGLRRPSSARPTGPGTAAAQGVGSANESPEDRWGLAWVVVALVRVRWLVLCLVAAVTAISAYLAFQLQPQLDVKEFFASDSDLVVGLEKLEQHVDLDLAGEPGVVYIRGDLTSHESLAAIEDLVAKLGENPNLGSNDDGQPRLYRQTVLTLLARLTGSDYARGAVEAEFGVRITDDDGDGLPDNPRQLRAAYQFMHRHGVPRSADSLYYDPQQVQETVSPYSESGSGPEMATILIFGVRGTREQATLALVRQSLEADLENLRRVDPISFAGVTGSPFTRESTLHAATRALNTSLPVAVAACLALLAVWLRSLRLAVAAVIPMGLVVTWLYAFMYLAGFHLNFVTATIAAVSVGLGIDYSIHVTLRFRREMERNPDAAAALRATAAGVGGPLIGSAASSAIGFGVLGFAPMPLFSAYGIITAVMIVMAAVAALVVLPSLLTLALGRPTRVDGEASGSTL